MGRGRKPGVSSRPGRAGGHRLVVPMTNGDLAGNNGGEAFDVDGFEDVHRPTETSTVAVAFTV